MAPVAYQKNLVPLLLAVVVVVAAVTPQGREMAGVVFFSAPLLLVAIAVATLALGRPGLIFSTLLAAFSLLAACFKIVFP